MKERETIKGFDNEEPHEEMEYLGVKLECSMPSRCLHGVFNASFLAQNYKKLDQYYQKKLTPKELDERHFIHTDNRILTPFKLSPFARENYMHKHAPQTPHKSMSIVSGEVENLEPPHKRILNSSRTLNYEN